MLQKIIEGAAYLLGDEKCIEDLNQYKSSSQTEENSPINYYITLINFVLSDIAKNYNCYVSTEVVTSNEFGEIVIGSLDYSVVMIKRVLDDGRAVKFGVVVNTIFYLSPNKEYTIVYYYYPHKIGSLADNLVLPVGLDYTTVCYGVLYEYFSSKMQFAEADFWLTRYKQGLRILGHKYCDIKFRLG